LAFTYLIPYGYQKNLLQNDINNADSSYRQELGDWLKLGIVFGVAGAGAGAFGIILLIKGQRAQQTRSRGSG